MLNPWFNKKSDDDWNADHPRRSLGPLRNNADRIEQSADNNLPPTKRSTFLSAFSSPHDAVLAKLHGQSTQGIRPSESTHAGAADQLKENNNDNGEPLPSHDEKLQLPSQVHESSADRLKSTRGVYSTANFSQPGLKGSDILYDPYNGAPLGILTSPPYGESSRSSTIHTNRSEGERKDEELWSHLSRVLDLQNQVAKMHVEMEGVGAWKTGDGKGKGTVIGKGKDKAKGTMMRDFGKGTGGAAGRSGQSAGMTTVEEREPEVDEDGVEVAGDEEEEKNRAREEEFAKLAGQFEGRKDSVNEIMDKLDGLSKALTQFHALQAPNIEFPPSSRQSSLGATHDPPPSLSSTVPQGPRVNPESLPDTGFAVRPVRKGGATSTVIPMSLSRSAPSKSPVSTLIVNSLDPGTQTHLMDSPVSTIGSLQLSPTE